MYQVLTVESSVQFSHSVVSDSLRPHESQHARPPCPSPIPGVHSDSKRSSNLQNKIKSSAISEHLAPILPQSQLAPVCTRSPCGQSYNCTRKANPVKVSEVKWPAHDLWVSIRAMTRTQFWGKSLHLIRMFPAFLEAFTYRSMNGKCFVCISCFVSTVHKNALRPLLDLTSWVILFAF